MDRRKPNEPLHKKHTDNGNTTKSDGASLAMGSSEYRELIADRMGMDEFEQRDAKRDRAGYRETEEFKDEDVWHQEQKSKAAEIAEGMYQEHVMANHRRLTTAQRDVSHQIQKAALTDATMKVALREAAKTETKSDDKAVKRRMPKMLEKQVYDNGVTEDDYYPGYKALHKFI